MNVTQKYIDNLQRKLTRESLKEIDETTGKYRIPENQWAKIQGYFDILAELNMEQVLKPVPDHEISRILDIRESLQEKVTPYQEYRANPNCALGATTLRLIYTVFSNVENLELIQANPILERELINCFIQTSGRPEPVRLENALVKFTRESPRIFSEANVEFKNSEVKETERNTLFGDFL